MALHQIGTVRSDNRDLTLRHWTHHTSNIGTLAVDDPASYESKKRLVRELADEGKIEHSDDASPSQALPTNTTKKTTAATVKRQTLLQRIDHLTWAWFTLPMATGGLALLLGSQPHTFRGLRTIGKVVFVLDLCIFATLATLIGLRFVRGGRARLLSSLTNPTESFFAPTFMLSTASIIPGIRLYGGPACGAWLATAVLVLFWIYVALSLLLAVAQYSLLFSGVQLTIHSMTPAWLLPIFPAMLSGTVAGTVAGALTSTLPPRPDQALPVVVAGLTLQGLGWWTSLFVYALYTLRLMQSGFPAPDLRPGMFIAVGPPGFTSVALLELAAVVPTDISYLARHPDQRQVLQTLALCFSISIWAVAFFWWCVGVVASALGARRMSFHLVWYAWVFPNVGFTLATIHIGRQLDSPAILWLGSVMTVLLVAVYLFVLGAHARAVYLCEILWPGRDEDRDTL